MTQQDQYDDALFDYSRGDYGSAIAKLGAILAGDPAHFDAQLSIAMCHYRQGDYAAAIAEGQKAALLKPDEQLVHTNLSLFYMKAGDKGKAEQHGLKARISSWRGNMAPPPGRGRGSRPAHGRPPGAQSPSGASRHAVEDPASVLTRTGRHSPSSYLNEKLLRIGHGTPQQGFPHCSAHR